MDVTVRFFASLREVTGLRDTSFRVEAGSTLENLLDSLIEAYPGLQRHRESMLLAVNEEFADLRTPLQAGDQVALLPPVSGGSSRQCWVQGGTIDVEAVLRLVRDARAGAVVLFLGTVRDEPGVAALEYEAYESMAVKQLERLRKEARSTFGVVEMAIVQRTGRLPVGETSVAVACSAPHRQAAFDACEWAMDELKKTVPIWKTERE